VNEKKQLLNFSEPASKFAISNNCEEFGIFQNNQQPIYLLNALIHRGSSRLVTLPDKQVFHLYAKNACNRKIRYKQRREMDVPPLVYGVFPY